MIQKIMIILIMGALTSLNVQAKGWRGKTKELFGKAKEKAKELVETVENIDTEAISRDARNYVRDVRDVAESLEAPNVAPIVRLINTGFGVNSDYFLLNQEYEMNVRDGYRLPNYSKNPLFINHCMKLYKYSSKYNVKNLGFIKEIDKKDRIKPRKKPTKDPFDIIAFDLTTKLPYKGKVTTAKYRFYYYRSKYRFSHDSEKNPLVIVSPSIKGIKAKGLRAIETKWTEEFAKNGINSIIMSLDEDLLNPRRPFALMDRWLAKQVIGMRLMIEFAKNDLAKDIDMENIGAIGASLGGIRTALLMGVENTRIKAGILIAAGGNFPDLWTSSEQKYVKKYRDARIEIEKILGWNKTEKLKFVYNSIKKSNCTDPIIFTPRRVNFADDVKMLVGTKDKKVPTKNQLELWAAMGKPRDVKGHPKHQGVIWASANGYKADLARFFSNKFRF